MERVRPSVVRTGDVIEGRYRLLNIIGQGGMGTVYLAEHVLIQRRVAVKVLHPELATDGAVVERFMNEARAAGTLGHPNIIESTDMGFAGAGVPYIVFEYLEGTSLFDEVYRLGGIRPTRALKIARQIAAALGAAHSAGIVHCDLKSDNVFLTDKDDVLDHVKVLDFGISRFLSFGRPRDGEQSGVVLGTPEFMAPEQINAPDSVDARADIYALGVVLYEMLERRTPFVQDPKDPEALLQAILADPPPAFSRADLPAALKEMIIEKLLAKEPAKRYSSMKDVESALEAFAGILHRDSMPIREVVPPPPIGRYPVLGDHGLGPMPVVRSSVELAAHARPALTEKMLVPESAAPAPPAHRDTSRGSRDTSRGTSRDTSGDTSRDTSRGSSRDTSRGSSRDTSRGTSKDSPGLGRRRLAVVAASFAVCMLGPVAWLATRSPSRASQATESSPAAQATESSSAAPATESSSAAPATESLSPAPAPTPTPAPVTAASPQAPSSSPLPSSDLGDGAATEPPETAAPAARTTPHLAPERASTIAKRRLPARPARTGRATTSVENKPPTASQASTPTTWDKDSPLPPP